ncbi:alanine racemase domain-containing protein [Myxococcus stipitatus DSM 14675]|uniref:Alanine racemase domain-containing protein n=1 Tax=Myxococcus stipitatus (strain DSM 14675 / JCM 12634 / Mx s8) TaxID=1278073 RepID=L7UA56_MYXSD|nr:alanine racemase [Myxococcus stipitatus]AGC44913.1 alanine racemase domain-containing protein [Myxococcus stipitatus DSM 14675]
MRGMENASLAALMTPAALVDLERVEANLQRVSRYTREHGLRWRPHTKTHKTAELTALQLAAGAVGATVATPREAEVMATVTPDILFAYPPVGAARLAKLLSLPARTKLTVALDSPESLAALSRAAGQAGRDIGVLVELDLGMRRVGVETPEQAVALARAIQTSPALTWRGVIFYPGHVRAPLHQQAEAVREQNTRLGAFLEALARAQLKPEVVSGGSTPMLWRSHEVKGLTEIRPGINVLNDRNTASIGACAWDDCAFSVLATVVSTAVPGQVVIDAGSKALAKEEGLAPEGGYGALLDRPDIVVRNVSEEHGLLDVSAMSWRPRVGDLVRVVPNHVCASVNLHERLHVLRGGTVTDTWAVAARGW